LVPNDTNGGWDDFLYDQQTGTVLRVSVNSNGEEQVYTSDPGKGNMSADGRYVVFRSTANNLVPGDTNGVQDIFLHERETGLTERISVSSAGTEANGPSEPIGHLCP
jgi:hypothetical protein